jgi:hypothetical protein
MLSNADNYQLQTNYNRIAFEMRTKCERIKSIIADFGLFNFDESNNFFWSESLRRRLAFRDEKSKKASESAKKRWERSESNANALQSQSESNANEMKGNEMKGKSPLTPQGESGFPYFDSAFDKMQVSEILKEELLLHEKSRVSKGGRPKDDVQWIKLFERLKKESDKHGEDAVVKQVSKCIENGWSTIPEIEEKKNFSGGNTDRENTVEIDGEIFPKLIAGKRVQYDTGSQGFLWLPILSREMYETMDYNELARYETYSQSERGWYYATTGREAVFVENGFGNSTTGRIQTQRKRKVGDIK